jgi:hypothetical protein
MGATFTFNHDHKVAFGEQVLAADWMADLMLRQAERGAAHARSISPRSDDDSPGHEHFQDHIEAGVYLRRIPGLDTPGPGRMVGRVSVDVEKVRHAPEVEFGTDRQAGHRPLGRSLDVMKKLG